LFKIIKKDIAGGAAKVKEQRAAYPPKLGRLQQRFVPLIGKF
jgi:hypothetical protein